MKITEAYLKKHFNPVEDQMDGEIYLYYELNLTDGAYLLSDEPFNEVIFGEFFNRKFTTTEEVDALIQLWKK